MPLAKIHLAAVVPLLALLLAACGGDGDPVQTTAPAVTGATEATDVAKAPGTERPEDEPSPDPASDREAVAATLEGVLTGTEPRQVCDELVTERYVSRSFGDPAGCRAAQADQQAARRVDVTRVDVLPDSLAQAQVVPRGGIYDGETLRAELVLDHDGWKLDSLRSDVPVGP